MTIPELMPLTGISTFVSPAPFGRSMRMVAALVLWFKLYGRDRRYGKSNKNYRQHAYRGRRR